MILVDIYVTALNEEHEFRLDENRPIEEVVGELGNMLFPLQQLHEAEAGSRLLLCSREAGRILNRGLTLREEGIGTGNRLLLI